MSLTAFEKIRDEEYISQVFFKDMNIGLNRVLCLLPNENRLDIEDTLLKAGQNRFISTEVFHEFYSKIAECLKDKDDAGSLTAKKIMRECLVERIQALCIIKEFIDNDNKANEEGRT